MVLKKARSARVAALFASTGLLTALASSAVAQDALGTTEADPNEIIVTAQKRAESLQDVPVSIVALNTEKLENLQVRNFVDYIAYIPSASFTTGSTGTPGNNSVSFRGISTGGGLITSGTLPTVGTYLDEQPITSILGTVDIHVYDIARVEALAGPQGTLYGASSEAGTVRIITNRPDASAFYGRVDAEVNTISHGDWGGQLEGFVNVPIVADRVALRTVAWYEHTGGYIDNAPRSRTFPSSKITQSNAALVEKDHNPVDIVGARAQLGIDLDDDWTITPSLTIQHTKWDGSFQSDDDKVGELKVAHYYPEFGKDDWYQVGATITGKIADFEVTYAGYYMRRKIDTQNDYSDYGYFYDLVAGSGTGVIDNAGKLIDPSQINTNRFRLRKVSQELRIATPQKARFRAIAGLFYQRQFQRDENNYITPGFADRLSIPGRPGQVWLTLEDRVDRDYAAFAQADFDLTPKLTLTGGVRAYKFDNTLGGFFGVNTTYYGTGVRQCLGRAQGGGPFKLGPALVPGSPCTNLGILNADGTVSPKRSKGDGFTYRANATYRFSKDNLVFATYSTGFRPGGINRAGAAVPFGADKLYNYEIGTKNSFLDRRLTLNLTAFLADWNNVQVTYQPPGGGGVALIGNVGKARSKGLEGDLSFRAAEGLTFTAAASYIDAKLKQPFILSGRITAPAGQRLPLTPKFKGNFTGRYEWSGASDDSFHVQLDGAYIGERDPVITTSDLRKTGVLPDYFTLGASAGLVHDGWELEAYVRNLTDARGQQSRAARCNINYCGPTTADPVGEIYRIYIQPRTIGLRVGRKF